MLCLTIILFFFSLNLLFIAAITKLPCAFILNEPNKYETYSIDQKRETKKMISLYKIINTFNIYISYF